MFPEWRGLDCLRSGESSVLPVTHPEESRNLNVLRFSTSAGSIRHRGQILRQEGRLTYYDWAIGEMAKFR
jgi:hypothetical protein